MKQRYDTDVTRGGGTEVDDEVLWCFDIKGPAEFHKKNQKVHFFSFLAIFDHFFGPKTAQKFFQDVFRAFREIS